MKGLIVSLILLGAGPVLADYKCTGQSDKKALELNLKFKDEVNERKNVQVNVKEVDLLSQEIKQFDLNGELTSEEFDDFGMYKVSLFDLKDQNTNKASLEIVKSTLATRGGRGDGFGRTHISAELKYLDLEYFYDCKISHD